MKKPQSDQEKNQYLQLQKDIYAVIRRGVAKDPLRTQQMKKLPFKVTSEKLDWLNTLSDEVLEEVGDVLIGNSFPDHVNTLLRFKTKLKNFPDRSKIKTLHEATHALESRVEKFITSHVNLLIRENPASEDITFLKELHKSLQDLTDFTDEDKVRLISQLLSNHLLQTGEKPLNFSALDKVMVPLMYKLLPSLKAQIETFFIFHDEREITSGKVKRLLSA